MTKKKMKVKRATAPHNRKKHVTGPGKALPLQKIMRQALGLHQAGSLQEAEALYRKILLAEPNHFEALQYLGLLAHQLGRNDIAEDFIQRALFLKPDYADAHINLGVVFMAQGKVDEAVASFHRALDLDPDNAQVYFNLGNIYRDQGKLEEGMAVFHKAIALKPDYVKAHNNLGIMLQTQGKFDEAVASFRRASELHPDNPLFHYNIGNSFKDQGKFAEAVASYRRALVLNPDYVEVYINLGITLNDQGKPDEAITSYHNALALKPDHADTYINLGLTLKDQGKPHEAVGILRRALDLNPDSPEAYNNLGNALKDLGKLDDAVANLRRAVVLKPDYAIAHSDLLMCLNYLPGQSNSQYCDEAAKYGRNISVKAGKRFTDWHSPSRPDRLRIGLVSGDFRNHPVGYFLENMLANLEATRIELLAYPTNRLTDSLTERIRPRFSSWKPLTGLDDEIAASLIRDDGVHVLIDLSGHTRYNRLPVFAWKPAPVQATWLGYFASTGLAEMDYIIADPVSVPESHRENFTETVWYLPETRLCFSPPVVEKEPPLTPLPALGNGYITFGCFQDLAKINDEVLAVWGRILQDLPKARLRLQNRQLNSAVIRKELRGRLMQCGIAPGRVSLEKVVPRLEYLASHAHIDIILDTFPFSGGTTTCEALWMGVPTMTLAGKTMVGRQGASLLACAGLSDWIAGTIEDYAVKAAAHTADLERLARLRAGLRQQVLASPLFDGAGFARDFEKAAWDMWQCFDLKRR